MISAEVLRLARAIPHWLMDDEPPLPETPVAACFWWAERLASAADRTPRWMAEIGDRYGIPPTASAALPGWLAAAEILSDWPARLGQFLSAFQAVAKHRTTFTGISRAFGLLLREAAHLEQLGYAAPADALRSYLLQRYDRGHLNAKVCLFQMPRHQRLIAQRPWLTQTEAARRLGLRHGAVAELVRRGLLAGRVTATGRRGRSIGLVSKQSVEALRRQLRSALTVPDAARRLGIGRSRVLELVRSDVLSGSVRTARGWLIPERSVQGLLRVYEQLPAWDGRKEPEWLSRRDATRVFGRSGLTLVKLLELTRRHRIGACRDPRHKDFRGLRVRRDDLEEVLPEIQRHQNARRGYPLSRLARELVPGQPLKDVVLRKWIAAGLLSAERVGRIWRVPPKEVERFRSDFCLAAEACRLLGISRSTLSRWEAEEKITAAYGRRTTPGAGASVFRHADIQRLLAANRPSAGD